MDYIQNIQENSVLPLYNTVIFPGSVTQIALDNKEAGKILALYGDNNRYLVGLTVRENSEGSDLENASFYSVGTLLKIESLKTTQDGMLAQFRALKKIHIEELEIKEQDIFSMYTFLSDVDDVDDKMKAEILNSVKTLVKDLGKNFQGSESYIQAIEKIETVDEIIGTVLPLLSVPLEEKQRLLEETSQRKIGLMFIDILQKQKQVLDVQIEMSQKMNEKMNKNHRETILREQLKAIQEELGEGPGSPNGKDYRKLIEEAQMPDEVKKVALEQVNKLESMGPQNHEAGVVQNYLDLLVQLPWKTPEYKEIDIEKAREILEQEHYGIEKVKTRIIQHLAVMKLKKEKKGSIILLVGPPGTGKTSLGKSIAHAMDRKYVRLSLGGIRDEAEIRGHRRTYVGALPGRIIQGMKKAGEKNPVFVLDEVDKLMASYSGDPASALLEVLDPEQNNTFADHYLEVPYDLSDVFFVATANSLSSIPGPLLDRMEVIEMSSYTNNEKFHIGKNHLLDSVLDDHGLDAEKLVIEDEALEAVIKNYTREAGVRGLKKELAKIARVASEKIVTGEVKGPFVVKEDMLKEVLGRVKVRLDDVLQTNMPGVVTGLAWTPVGGDILFIEGSLMPGKGELILTGQLGDVMKESARISMSLIRSRLVHLINQFDFSKNDLHIHVPSGAIPKDGPSAGITLFTALASLLLGKSVDPKLAMTGEITLRGSVLPVGGIKEKVLAAHRAGIKRILLSRENEDDLKDIPEDVRESLTFVLVERIEDVVKEALDIELPKPEYLSLNKAMASELCPN